MLIKYQALAASLQKKNQALYVLVGQDQYLLNDAAFQIKTAWRKQGETDTKTLQLNNPSDWQLLIEEANSYSLFSEYVLIDSYWDKKTIDKTGKEIIQHYLKTVNPRCLIILRAPNVSAKQLSWLSNQAECLIVQIYPFSTVTLQGWIAAQLKNRSILHDQKIPLLIQQYTQGNMLAAAQAIEKIALTHEPGERVTHEAVIAHLTDQCDYQLYELADACLGAQAEKAVHLLRQARNARREPSLVLWLLTQEIRQLIQLSHRVRSLPFQAACSELKIWSNRAHLYQSALARLPLARLYKLLSLSQLLDEQIKSNSSLTMWLDIEKLALQLALFNFNNTQSPFES